MMRKRAGWLCVLFLGHSSPGGDAGFEGQIAQAVMLVAFIRSSSALAGIRARRRLADHPRNGSRGDRWQRLVRSRSGAALGAEPRRDLGVLGFVRSRPAGFGWYDYGPVPARRVDDRTSHCSGLSRSAPSWVQCCPSDCGGSGRTRRVRRLPSWRRSSTLPGCSSTSL